MDISRQFFSCCWVTFMLNGGFMDFSQYDFCWIKIVNNYFNLICRYLMITISEACKNTLCNLFREKIEKFVQPNIYNTNKQAFVYKTNFPKTRPSNTCQIFCLNGTVSYMISEFVFNVVLVQFSLSFFVLKNKKYLSMIESKNSGISRLFNRCIGRVYFLRLGCLLLNS